MTSEYRYQTLRVPIDGENFELEEGSQKDKTETKTDCLIVQWMCTLCGI